MKGAYAVMRGIEAPRFTVCFQNNRAKEGAVNFNNMGFKHGSAAFTCPRIMLRVWVRQYVRRLFYWVPAFTMGATGDVLHR
ncbi:hypothetical protein JCM25156A_07250 [Komagataeibacter kakiaceti JCM 25156]